MHTKILKYLSFVLLLFLIAGCSNQCSSFIAKYNQVAYENAVSLKVDSLVLMDKASEPYDTHKEEVTELIANVEKAYEYANGIPKNTITTKQWEIMKDPGKNLLGGFLERWKKESQLNPVFITEAKKQVSEGFDMIIQLESGKIKPTEIKGE